MRFQCRAVTTGGEIRDSDVDWLLHNSTVYSKVLQHNALLDYNKDSPDPNKLMPYFFLKDTYFTKVAILRLPPSDNLLAFIATSKHEVYVVAICLVHKSS